jgi:hypothetical protein
MSLPANQDAVLAALRTVLERAEAQVKTMRDPTELAVMHEATTDLIDSLARMSVRVKALRDSIGAALEREMGDGEAVVAPSTGRVAFIGPLADGKARVREEAVNEMGRELPSYLLPKTFTRYPTVTDIRDAVKHGELRRDQAADLIEEPPTRMGLRWRSMDTEAVEA